MKAGRSLLVLAALALAGLLGSVVAVEPAAALRFRRVLVPEQDVDQVVRGLLPMRREEFERLVQLSQAARRPGESPARIASAQYRARLAGDALIDGQLELAVVHAGPAAAPLDLAGTDLAIHRAHWSASGGREAPLGVDPAGKLVCLVPQSGTLTAAFSLSGQRDQRGDLVFDFHLPPSPLQEMNLVLPAELVLSAEGAIAQRAANVAGKPRAAGDVATWRLSCANSGRITLRIAKSSTEQQSEPLVLVKQQSAYTVHRGAIDVEATFEIDAQAQPLSRLVFTGDASLELVAVRQGETRLDFRPLAVSGQARQYTVEFVPPLAAGANVVRLTATAVWDGRGSRRLPAIQVVGATWQEGQISVAADGTLGVEVAPQDDCRTIGYVAASPSQPASTWQFQQLTPGAGVNVALAENIAALSEQSATAVEFGPTQISGVYTAEVTASAGAHFALVAEIPRAWIVDSVEVQPPDMLADRALTNPAASRGDAAPQRLMLTLGRPLVAGRPLRYIVRAHQRRPPGEDGLPGRFFSIATISGVRDSRRLATWQVTDPAAQLVLTPDERLRRVDFGSLSPAQQRLFDVPPRGQVFEVDDAADSVQARLVRTSGKYRLDALVRATIEQSAVQEEWKLHITPEDSGISRIVVHRRPASGEVGQWRIEGEDPREIAVRQLPPLAEAGSQSVFEVTLARPRQAPFEVTARFVRRRGEHQELGLVSSPAATSQSGRVEIHATPGVQVAIDSEGLQPGALDDAVASPATLRGLFEYDPDRVVRLSWHKPLAQRSLPLAWIGSLDIESACLADGTARHQVVFQVHSAGQDRLEFRLTDDATAVQAQVSDRPARGLVAGPGNRYSVSVNPSGHTEVLVHYGTRHSPIGWLGTSRVSSPAPVTELPVLARRWDVRLPAELVPLSPSWSESISSSPAVDRHWTTYSAPWRPGAIPSLRIAKRASVTGWSFCLGLGAFAAAICWRQRLTRCAVLAVLAGVAWLLVPAALTTLPAAGFAGLLLGALWLLVVPRSSPTSAPRTTSTPGRNSNWWPQTAGAGVLLLVAFAVCRGQAGAPQPGGNVETTWRVVIPVNDVRQPVGDYVFLEPKLYDALVALTDQLPFATPDWLLASAVYRPALAAGAAEDPLRIEEIGATFALETYRSQVTVALGFRRTDIHLIQRAARLDGEPIVLEWSEDGSSLRAAIDDPGKHRLELAFGALPQVTADGGSLELAIPRAAGSRVELPENAQGLRVDDPRGAAFAGAAPESRSQGVRTSELGAATRLALRWSKNASQGAEPLRTEAEQLLLWTIRPGSVAAKGKLRVRPLGGPIRHLEVDLDSRLRVLPPPPSGVVSRQWVQPAGSTNRLHLDLAQPATAEVTVPLALVVADSSGIGNLTLPRVSVHADDVQRSWHALALAGNLQWNPPPTARTDDPPSSAFAQAWGEAIPDSLVVLNAQGRSLPELHTQPMAASIRVVERIDCSVSQGSLSAVYLAELTGTTADIYVHRLKVSPGWQVHALNLVSSGVPMRADWRQSADGDVVITQHQPAAASVQLTLEARRSLPAGEPTVPAPLIEYVGASERRCELRVFRQSDVRLKITDNSRRWTADDSAAAGQFQEGLGRLAAAYRAAPGALDRTPTITAESNQPAVSGHVLSRLVPAEGSWSVQIDAALEVERGELDQLRLVIPRELDSALSISPAAEYELVTAPGQVSQLVVRPQRSYTSDARLTIQGRLAVAEGPVLRPAAAWMRGAERVRHLVALPASHDGRQFEWETTGMQALDAALLPASLGPLPPGYDLYDVLSPQHAAAGRQRPAIGSPPQIRRAAHRLRPTASGELVGSSLFAVLPRGARHFDLTLPPNCRLLHVALDGVPAQLVDRGGATWRLPNLGGERQHQVALDYVAVLEPAALGREGRRFRPPSISRASPGEVTWDVPPGGWATLKDGSVLVPMTRPPITDWRWPAWLALAATALCWIVGHRPAVAYGLLRLTPFWLALFGAGWLTVGPWPALGWLAVALALWLAMRSPWVRAGERSLSGIFAPGRPS